VIVFWGFISNEIPFRFNVEKTLIPVDSIDGESNANPDPHPNNNGCN
jgi:hypothetical protein